MVDAQPHLDSLRRTFIDARADLFDAVREACPGYHRTEQHRDRKPPWCALCGRDDLGRVQHEPPGG